MSEKAPRSGAAMLAKTPFKSLLWSLPMILLTWFMFTGGQGLPRDPLRLIPFVITIVLVNAVFFLALYTGRTDRWRAVIFVITAVSFIISFICNFQESRGSMSISEAEMIKGRVPFCHIVIPQTSVVTALTRTIIFPGSMEGNYSITSMIVLWLGASLALGRGFCGWGCFFGGLEDGFSRILKKPIIKRIPEKWTYLPYAVLVVVILASTALLTPFYCEWLCPFKAVTEYAEVNSLVTFLQTTVFLSLFAGLVVILPILTKRRTQCGLFCPMGAFQSCTNKIDPFEIRFDRDKCKDCGQCEQVCPTFSVSKNKLTNGNTRLSCIKCGKCVDVCAHGAATFHVKGTALDAKGSRGRMFFLFPAFLFLSIFGGFLIQDGLYRLLRLITMGSPIQ